MLDETLLDEMFEIAGACIVCVGQLSCRHNAEGASGGEEIGLGIAQLIGAIAMGHRLPIA